ncbi:baseplate J/gp47 family protein [Streptomyces sp. NPDC058739]|uniref:baseplate J/gp47 family protein n=1 Tax=Streptomyces sp. NPDC058739 TaxID=3346618 RepID=UPI0036744B78
MSGTTGAEPGSGRVSRDEVIAEIARSATAARPVPHLPPDASGTPPTWADLLFHDPVPQGRTSAVLRQAGDPSQAVLLAVATLHEGLARHFAQLPARARLAWLSERLGIPRRPMEPDSVVAAFTVAPPRRAEPAAGPVVLPSGTELRGGRTPGGAERIYATTDTLTLQGAEISRVMGTLAAADGDWTADRRDPDAPFAPFAGQAAVHRLDIVSDVLAFTGGTATVTVTFPGQDTAGLAGTTWQWSTPDGLATVLPGSPVYDGESVRLVLTGACGPLAVDGEQLTFLRACFDGDAAPTGAFAFETADVRVRMEREAVIPDGGATGNGALDITREFQPFGPTPRRGDSFYLRSEETFGKPLDSLTLTFELLDDSGNGLMAVDYAAPVQQWYAEGLFAKGIDVIGKIPYKEPDPGIQWQRRAGGTWQTFSTAGRKLHGRRTAAVAVGGTPLSDPTEVGGVTGHFVRLFLSSGDFGWEDHLRRIARFAEDVATARSPRAGDLIAPTPPTASRVTIGYRTQSVSVRDLRTRNGHATRRLDLPGPVARPFRQPLDTSAGAHGAVAVGFAGLRPDAVGGLSFHVRVGQAPACASSGRGHDVTWEYWSTADAWQPLHVLDGTKGLRQSGVVRTLLPADWAEGCADQGAATDRWLRLRASTPQLVGEILDIRTDAVTTVCRSAPDPEADGSPSTAPAAGELKGLRRPIPGVKVSNPGAGTPGRAAETDEEYLRRATGVVRHRGRAIQPWDYETLVKDAFPEVAAVRCLPHTGADGCAEPGSVALVVVPRGGERLPLPGVTLAERILARLEPLRSPHARPVVLCPLYEQVGVHARIALAPGVAAAEARESLTAALEARLHPGGSGFAEFGRALYPSSLTVFLEDRPEVDHVRDLRLLPPHTGLPRVGTDACRGLIASAGEHELVLEERL